jgi:hypothetical protein
MNRQISNLLGHPFPLVTEQPKQPRDDPPYQHYNRPPAPYQHDPTAAPYRHNPPAASFGNPGSAFIERTPAQAFAPAAYQPPPPRAGPSNPTHSKPRTSYEGLEKYGHTPLAEISTNLTIPNKFKVRARVLKVESANKKGGGYTTKFCLHCKQR